LNEKYSKRSFADILEVRHYAAAPIGKRSGAELLPIVAAYYSMLSK